MKISPLIMILGIPRTYVFKAGQLFGHFREMPALFFNDLNLTYFKIAGLFSKMPDFFVKMPDIFDLNSIPRNPKLNI